MYMFITRSINMTVFVQCGFAPWHEKIAGIMHCFAHNTDNEVVQLYRS